jgi:tRNA A37 threonylcarbamoyladenosine synthetase subunit TsaC/SUA5/YrdC
MDIHRVYHMGLIFASLRLCVFAFIPTLILLERHSHSLHYFNAKPQSRKAAGEMGLIMQSLTEKDISLAAQMLKEGIPVAFPTETVYGLGAQVFDVAAVEKIFQMKGRPADNPLICHIANLDQLYLLAREVPETALKLAAHFWPGPLTLILKKTTFCSQHCNRWT